MTDNTHNTDMAIRATTALSPLQRRLAARKSAGTGTMLLLDTSSSMADRVRSDGEPMTKIDMLRAVVDRLRSDGLQFTQICFSDSAEFTDLIPEPRGGTNMVDALERAAERKPRHLILISDGEPNSRELTLSTAHALLADVVIDTFYVGSAGGPGETFLQQLSGAHRGAHGVTTKVGELTSGIRLALAAGSAEDIARGPIAL